MTIALTPRLIELEKAVDDAAGEYDTALMEELAVQLKAAYPGATRVNIYANDPRDREGADINTLEINGVPIADDDWMESEDDALIDRMDALQQQFMPLTEKLTGPVREHPGATRWYSL